MDGKLLVILGPTATGKTDLGLELAKKYQGELIACDSRQIYQGLDIWSGKYPGQYQQIEKFKGYWVVDGIKIWGYDLVDWQQHFNAKQYQEFAEQKIAEISARDKLPIIVGGTGLYLRGLLVGLDEINEPVDELKRQEMEDQSLEELQQKMMTLSPAVWESLNNSDRQNKRRLIRHLEKLSQSSIKIDPSPTLIAANYQILKIGLDAPREVLNRQIDRRIEKQMESGLVEEGREFLQTEISENKLRELGLEYASLRKLVSGEISRSEFANLIKTKIHQYAKRQQTWFKKESGVEWFDVSSQGWRSKLDKVIGDWYNNRHEPTN